MELRIIVSYVENRQKVCVKFVSLPGFHELLYCQLPVRQLFPVSLVGIY